VSVPTLVATATHHVCGSPLDPADRMASALVRCQHCHEEVDQDYNALCHLLTAADQAMPG
jgi:transposase